MEVIILVFEVIAEIIIPGILELMFWRVRVPENNFKPGVLTFLMSLILGTGLGVISVYLYKITVISALSLKLLYLIACPIIVALGIVQLYRVSNRKKEGMFLFANFLNAYVFALSFVLIRFFMIK